VLIRLYNPSGGDSTGSAMSPYMWMREEFDRGTDSSSAPKSLLQILDRAGRGIGSNGNVVFSTIISSR